MAENANVDSVRYYARSYGHDDVLTELDESGKLMPGSWLKIVKGSLMVGNLNIAKYIITTHIEQESLNELLHVASESENTEIVDLLLQKGADINAVTRGKTALYTAVDSESLSAVKLLLKRRADPNIPTDSGLALHKAIQLKAPKIVQALLKAGASINAEADSALYWAIRSRNQSIIRLILNKNPADTEVGRSIGYVEMGEIDNLLKLFKKSRHMSTIFPGDTENGMYEAIRNDNITELKDLLKRGDFKNVPVDDRLTPLHVATYHHRNSIAEVLLSSGSDAFAKDINGETPVDYLLKNGDFFMLKLFRKMGVTFEEHSEMLLRATTNRLSNFIEYMIKHGADVSARNESGLTSLHIAVLNNDEKSVKILLEAGADPNAMCELGTPLHCIYWTINNPVASILFDYGADMNVVDAKGRRPLRNFELYDPRLIGSRLEKKVELRQIKVDINGEMKNCVIFGRVGDEESFEMSRKTEVDMLRKEMVDGLIIYDILVADKNRLARLSGNAKIQDHLNSDEFSKRYLIHGAFIKGRMNLGRIRRKSFDKSRRFFNHIVMNLPCICADKILEYLSNEELRVLEKACLEIEINLKKRKYRL